MKKLKKRAEISKTSRKFKQNAQSLIICKKKNVPLFVRKTSFSIGFYSWTAFFSSTRTLFIYFVCLKSCLAKIEKIDFVLEQLNNGLIYCCLVDGG